MDSPIQAPKPSVTSALGNSVELLLETFHGQEALGTPFRYDLTLLSTSSAIDVQKILGTPLTICLPVTPPTRNRYFHGIVTYFAKLGLTHNHTRYAVVVNPFLSLFDYTRDSRVFDTKTQTAITIATDEILKKRGLTDIESGTLIKDHLRKREYCVQYRETDLNFVQRLLEEEGIYYFFKHEQGKHTLVLANDISAHAEVKDYEKILCVPRREDQKLNEPHFWSLKISGALYPHDYTVLPGYDPEKNRNILPGQLYVPSWGKAVSQDPPPDPSHAFENYDYPGGLPTHDEADYEAKLRVQADHIANTSIEVEGNTIALGLGDLVKLWKQDGLYNPLWAEGDFPKDQKYIITSAQYSLSINSYESGETAASNEPFKATYTLVDANTKISPPRTARKPRIEGPQTAIVVGKVGDEINTDELGRVQVQFDWDRLHKYDVESSCWVRVSQIWAGKHWGAIHIPRIGQEVIVEFLDGDPDRPIITGRVYNKDNKPPYELTKHQTQSGIKSRSSMGGTESNFNEIRFEDLKGKEELHIQAELDMSTNVKRNQTLYVGGDQNVTIHGNQSISVHGTDEKTGKKLPIQSTTSVTGKHTFDASDTIKIQAPTSITLECGGSTIVMVPGSITITAGGGAKLVLDANALTQASGGGKTLHDANVFHQANAGAKILLDANVRAESSGGSAVQLDGNALVDGKGTATLQGASSAAISAGGSSVKTTAGGVDLTGSMVNHNA